MGRLKIAMPALLLSISGISVAQTATTVPAAQEVRNSIITGPVSGVVQQYNYYQSPDPVDRRFSSSITLSLEEMWEATTASASPGLHPVLYDPVDPAFDFAGQRGDTFLVYISDDNELIDILTGKNWPRCKAEGGIFVAGIAYGADLKPHELGLLHLKVGALSEGNRLLQAVCGVIGKQSTLPGTLAESESNFAQIANENGSFAALIFEPGIFGGLPFEEANVGQFWFGFDKGLPGTPGDSQRRIGREQMMRVGKELSSQRSADVEIDVTDMPGRKDFSDDARKIYGKRLDNLQSDWLNYVSSASVRTGGQRHAVTSSGHVSMILPRFQLSDLDSTRFWRRLDETALYSQSILCLAAAFAVNKGYSEPGELPFSRQC